MALTPTQIKNRLLGGSDAAAARGLSPYKTKRQLWAEITGRVKGFEGNIKTYWGEMLEDAIRQSWSDTYGKKVRQVYMTVVHPKYAFMTGHLDGKVEKELAGFEAKNVGWRMAEQWENGIPEHYRIQVIHYLACKKNWERFYVRALIGGQEHIDYMVERAGARSSSVEMEDKSRYIITKEQIKQHEVECRQFWRYVENDEPPPAVAVSDADIIHDGPYEGDVEAPENIIAIMKAEAELMAEKKVLEDRINKHRAVVADFLGNKLALVHEGDVLCTRKWQNGRRSVSVKDAELVCPEIIKTTAGGRVLRLNRGKYHG